MKCQRFEQINAAKVLSIDVTSSYYFGIQCLMAFLIYVGYIFYLTFYCPHYDFPMTADMP